MTISSITAQIGDAMSILAKITWFLSGCAKRKNIFKSLLKENNKYLDCDLMYEAEDPR